MNLNDLISFKCNNVVLGATAVIGIIGGIYLLTQSTRSAHSRIAERKIVKKKKDGQSVCNVCFTQIDTDDSKTCVACYSCAKNVCRGEKCSEWVPEDDEWRCQLCAATTRRGSYGTTSNWVQEQYAVKRASLTECSYPMRARSEIYIPLCDPNESAFLCNFESVSEVGSPKQNSNQKQHIREYIEEVLAEMIGGSLENATVEQISTNKDYQQVRNGHELQGVSNVRLRRLIESVIAETIRQPPFATTGLITTTGNAADSSDVGNGEGSPLNGGNLCNGNGGQYFESKKYHDLLATAVLNKIVNTHGNGRHSESSPDLTSSSVLDNNHNAINLNKTDESVSSSSSVEPRSESSLTDPIRSINKNDDDGNYGTFYHDDVANDNIEADRESVLSDFISSHMVPLPHISAEPASDEEDDDDEDFISVGSSRDANWEDNWLFKKKKSNKTSSSVGMLVPAPKEDIRALIGDKPTDEVSDLSEVGSDTDDSSLEMVSASLDPLNDRLVNKHLIGGKNTKIVLDELVDRTSMISTSSLPENEPPYTETKNEFVVSNDGLNESQPLTISVNSCNKAISNEAINSNVTKAIPAKVEKLAKESQVADDESIVPPPNDFTDDEKMRNLLAKFNEEQNGKTDSGDDNSSSMSPRSSISCALSAGIERAELDAYEGITDFCVEDEEGPASEIDPDMAESSSRRPSVIEILAAIALGPMLAVSASDDRNILTELELSSLMELNELAMAQMNAKTNEERRLGVIAEESFEISPGEEHRMESIECNEETDLLSSPKMVMDAIRDLVGREVTKSVQNEESSLTIEEITEESVELELSQQKISNESEKLASNDPEDSIKQSEEQISQDQLEIEETFEIISGEKELSEVIVQIETVPQIEIETEEEMKQEQSGIKKISPHELEQSRLNEIKPNDDDNGVTINSLSEELGFEKVIPDDTSSISDESLHTIGSSSEYSEDLDGDTTSFYIEEQKILVIAEMSTDQKLQEKITENQSSESDKTMNEFILPPPTAFCDKELGKLNEIGDGSEEVQVIEAHINSGIVQHETQITSQNSNNVPEKTVTEKETHNEKLCIETAEKTEPVQTTEIVEVSALETVESDEPPDKVSMEDTQPKTEIELVSLTETLKNESVQGSVIEADNKEPTEGSSQDKADTKIEETQENIEKIVEDQTAPPIINEPAALKTLSEAKLLLQASGKLNEEELPSTELNGAPKGNLGNLQQDSEPEAINNELQVTGEITNSSNLEELPTSKPSEEKNLSNQVDEVSEVKPISEVQPIEEPTNEQGSNNLIQEVADNNSESLENIPSESNEKAFKESTTENIKALLDETQTTELEENLKAEGLLSKNNSSEPQENVKTEENNSKMFEEKVNQESNILSIGTEILELQKSDDEHDKKNVDNSQTNEFIAEETIEEQNKNTLDKLSSNTVEQKPKSEIVLVETIPEKQVSDEDQTKPIKDEQIEEPNGKLSDVKGDTEVIIEDSKNIVEIERISAENEVDHSSIAKKSNEELSQLPSEELENNSEDQNEKQSIKTDQILQAEAISLECCEEQKEDANNIDTDIKLPETTGTEELVPSVEKKDCEEIVSEQSHEILENEKKIINDETTFKTDSLDIVEPQTADIATVEPFFGTGNVDKTEVQAEEDQALLDVDNCQTENETKTAAGSLETGPEENPTESQIFLQNDDNIASGTENIGEFKSMDGVNCELSKELVTEDNGNTKTETNEATAGITLTESVCIEEANSNIVVDAKYEETDSQTQENHTLLENLTDAKMDILSDQRKDLNISETKDEIKTECSNQQETISSNQSEETENITNAEPQNESSIVEDNATVSVLENQQLNEILECKTDDDKQVETDKPELTEDESIIESLTASEENEIKVEASAEKATVNESVSKTCLGDGENSKENAVDKQEEQPIELSKTSKVDEQELENPEIEQTLEISVESEIHQDEMPREDLESQSKSELSENSSKKVSAIQISNTEPIIADKVKDDTKAKIPKELIVEETIESELKESPSSEPQIESDDAEKSEKDGNSVTGDEMLDVNGNTLEVFSLTNSSDAGTNLESQDIEAVVLESVANGTEGQRLSSTTEINTERIQITDATNPCEELSVESSDLKSEASTEKTMTDADSIEESEAVANVSAIPASNSEVKDINEVLKENTLPEEVSGSPTTVNVANETNVEIQKAYLDLNQSTDDVKNIEINSETDDIVTKSDNATSDEDNTDSKTVEEKCETSEMIESQNEEPEAEDKIQKPLDLTSVSEESYPTVNTLVEQESQVKQIKIEEHNENRDIESNQDNTTLKIEIEEPKPTEGIMEKKISQSVNEQQHVHNATESEEECTTLKTDDQDIEKLSLEEPISAKNIKKDQIEPEATLLAIIEPNKSDEKPKSKETVCLEEISGNEVVTKVEPEEDVIKESASDSPQNLCRTDLLVQEEKVNDEKVATEDNTNKAFESAQQTEKNEAKEILLDATAVEESSQVSPAYSTDILLPKEKEENPPVLASESISSNANTEDSIRASNDKTIMFEEKSGLSMSEENISTVAEKVQLDKVGVVEVGLVKIMDQDTDNTSEESMLKTEVQHANKQVELETQEIVLNVDSLTLKTDDEKIKSILSENKLTLKTDDEKIEDILSVESVLSTVVTVEPEMVKEEIIEILESVPSKNVIVDEDQNKVTISNEVLPQVPTKLVEDIEVQNEDSQDIETTTSSESQVHKENAEVKAVQNEITPGIEILTSKEDVPRDQIENVEVAIKEVQNEEGTVTITTISITTSSQIPTKNNDDILVQHDVSLETIPIVTNESETQVLIKNIEDKEMQKESSADEETTKSSETKSQVTKENVQGEDIFKTETILSNETLSTLPPSENFEDKEVKNETSSNADHEIANVVAFQNPEENVKTPQVLTENIENKGIKNEVIPKTETIISNETVLPQVFIANVEDKEVQNEVISETETIISNETVSPQVPTENVEDKEVQNEVISETETIILNEAISPQVSTENVEDKEVQKEVISETEMIIPNETISPQVPTENVEDKEVLNEVISETETIASNENGPLQVPTENLEDKEVTNVVSPEIESKISSEVETPHELTENLDSKEDMNLVNPDVESTISSETETQVPKENVEDQAAQNKATSETETIASNETGPPQVPTENLEGKDFTKVVSPEIESTISSETETQVPKENVEDQAVQNEVISETETIASNEIGPPQDSTENLNSKEVMNVVNPDVESAISSETETQVLKENVEDQAAQNKATSETETIASNETGPPQVPTENLEGKDFTKVVSPEIESTISSETETQVPKENVEDQAVQNEVISETETIASNETGPPQDSTENLNSKEVMNVVNPDVESAISSETETQVPKENVEDQAVQNEVISETETIASNEIGPPQDSTENLEDKEVTNVVSPEIESTISSETETETQVPKENVEDQAAQKEATSETETIASNETGPPQVSTENLESTISSEIEIQVPKENVEDQAAPNEVISETETISSNETGPPQVPTENLNSKEVMNVVNPDVESAISSETETQVPKENVEDQAAQKEATSETETIASNETGPPQVSTENLEDKEVTNVVSPEIESTISSEIETQVPKENVEDQAAPNEVISETETISSNETGPPQASTENLEVTNVVSPEIESTILSETEIQVPKENVEDQAAQKEAISETETIASNETGPPQVSTENLEDKEVTNVVSPEIESTISSDTETQVSKENVEDQAAQKEAFSEIETISSNETGPPQDSTENLEDKEVTNVVSPEIESTISSETETQVPKEHVEDQAAQKQAFSEIETISSNETGPPQVPTENLDSKEIMNLVNPDVESAISSETETQVHKEHVEDQAAQKEAISEIETISSNETGPPQVSTENLNSKEVMNVVNPVVESAISSETETQVPKENVENQAAQNEAISEIETISSNETGPPQVPADNLEDKIVQDESCSDVGKTISTETESQIPKGNAADNALENETVPNEKTTISSEAESQIPKGNVEDQAVQNEVTPGIEISTSNEVDIQEKNVQNKYNPVTETITSSETGSQVTEENVEVQSKASSEQEMITSNETISPQHITANVEDKELKNEVSPASETTTRSETETRLSKEDVEDEEVQNEHVSQKEMTKSKEELRNKVSSDAALITSNEIKTIKVTLVQQEVSSEPLKSITTESLIPTDIQKVSSQAETIISNENESQKPTDNIQQSVVQDTISENEKVPTDKEKPAENNNESSFTNSDEKIIDSVIESLPSKDDTSSTPDIQSVNASVTTQTDLPAPKSEDSPSSPEVIEKVQSKETEDSLESKNVPILKENKSEARTNVEEKETLSENIDATQSAKRKDLTNSEETQNESSTENSSGSQNEKVTATVHQPIESEELQIQKTVGLVNDNDKPTVTQDAIGNTSATNTEEVRDDLVEQESKKTEQNTETDISKEQEKDNSILETVANEGISNELKSLEVEEDAITCYSGMSAIEALVEDMQTSTEISCANEVTIADEANEVTITGKTNISIEPLSSDSKDIIFKETENSSVKEDKNIEDKLQGSDSKTDDKHENEELSILSENKIDKSEKTSRDDVQEESNSIEKTVVESSHIKENLPSENSESQEKQEKIKEVINEPVQTIEIFTETEVNEASKPEKLLESASIISEEIQAQISSSLKISSIEPVTVVTDTTKVDESTSIIKTNEEPKDEILKSGELRVRTEPEMLPISDSLEPVIEEEIKKSISIPETKLEPNEIASGTPEVTQTKEIVVEKVTLTTVKQNENSESESETNSKDQAEENVSISEGLLNSLDSAKDKTCVDSRSMDLQKADEPVNIQATIKVKPTQVNTGEIQNQETFDTGTETTPQNQISESTNIITGDGQNESSSELDSKDAIKPEDENSKENIQGVIEVDVAEEKEDSIDKLQSKKVEDTPTQRELLDSDEGGSKNVNLEKEKEKEIFSKEEISFDHDQLLKKDNVQNLATDFTITHDSNVSLKDESISILTEEVSNKPTIEASLEKITEASEAIILKTTITEAVRYEKIIVVSKSEEPISGLKETSKETETVKSTQSIAELSKSAETEKEIDTVAGLDTQNHSLENVKVDEDNSQTKNSQQESNKVSSGQIQIKNIDIGAQTSAAETPEPIKLDTVVEEIKNPSQVPKPNSCDIAMAEDKLSEDMTEQVTEVEETPPIEVLKATCRIITHPPLQPTESLIESAQCLYDEISHPILGTSCEINTPTLAEELRMAADRNVNKELPTAERVIPQSIPCESRCFTPEPQLNESIARDSVASTEQSNAQDAAQDRISSESNCTDDSTTTVIETFGSMESRSNSDSGEEFSPDNSTDRESSATATTANINILTTTNNATNQSHIYSQPPPPQPELRTESACSKLLETRTTTGENEEHVDDDPLKHLVPGSIAEREYKKWYNAVEMPNNPYSVEALRRRLSGGLDRSFDLPHISPCNEDNPLQLCESPVPEAESKAQERDYSRYSRDYYINDAKQASGTTKKSPTSPPPPQISSPISTASSIELDERLKHNSNTVETTTPVKEMCHKLEKQCRIEADIYLATPVQVIEDIPQAFADKNSIQTSGSINSLTTEAVSKLSSETSSILTNESLTPSEDSDTIRIYDLKKQETRLVKESTQTTTITVPKSPEKKVRPTELDIVPTLAPPTATISSKSSTPTSFKFLQPKRKLINPSQVLSIDLDATPVASPTPEKPVIEAEVVHALPSVKALAKAFLLTSSTSSSDNKWRKARAKAPLQFLKSTTPTTTPTPTTVVPAANISRGIQKQPEPVIPDTTSQGSEDATIASDLSSLETDPPSRLDAGDALDSNADEDRAVSPVVLPGCLRNNIAFFENLKNK